MHQDGFDGLRFATVGAESNVAFRAFTTDQGAINIESEVDTDRYEGNEENEAYNGSALDEYRPGAEVVPPNAAMPDENAAAEDGADAGLGKTTAIKLVAHRSESLSDKDTGKFHTGFALDYMQGDADYHDVAGDGDIDRCGAWFYTTWLGDEGEYYDFVFKFGHLGKDFAIYAPTTGEKISGDYDNQVLSASLEYGRKYAKDKKLVRRAAGSGAVCLRHVRPLRNESGHQGQARRHSEPDRPRRRPSRKGFRYGKACGLRRARRRPA